MPRRPRESRLAAADRGLIEAIRVGLRAAADPAKAPQMQAYMKSAMPYHGVAHPSAQRIFREAIAAHPLDGFEAWHDTTLALWREASHREERYGALALAEHRRYRAHRTREAFPMYEEFVVTGAWWDLVDETAGNLLDELHRQDPDWMAARMREWSTAPEMWKRRASIICQLRHKQATDLRLLYDCIEPNMVDREFFIRKAIGWALRQQAWTDPDEVVRYVTANADRLSPLSKREALKNVLKSGRIQAIP
ncbi:MAG: DNA alkylation repair protein [Dehalococcoidia bacterium]|nr:DNA alkylation repair protein [Dehalococcoidia bacterium]